MHVDKLRQPAAGDGKREIVPILQSAVAFLWKATMLGLLEQQRSHQVAVAEVSVHQVCVCVNVGYVKRWGEQASVDRVVPQGEQFSMMLNNEPRQAAIQI